MPSRVRKTAEAKSADPANSRMADAQDKTRLEDDKPVIFYEKSATIRRGDDYFRATVAVTAKTGITESDKAEITKTFVLLDEIIEQEISDTLGI